MFFFSVQLQTLALVCYHRLYINFASKFFMNLYNYLQFKIKYLPTYACFDCGKSLKRAAVDVKPNSILCYYTIGAIVPYSRATERL